MMQSDFVSWMATAPMKVAVANTRLFTDMAGGREWSQAFDDYMRALPLGPDASFAEAETLQTEAEETVEAGADAAQDALSKQHELTQKAVDMAEKTAKQNPAVKLDPVPKH
ncbi:hypothetical protein [Roseobacter sp. HKCCA0434]|uniref:hypothetical protein n=1 Tax=Roseobacter sp. HKCCA0434 TaxID=3079297 RepID=UPI002905BBD6|nr:hypothetical protein [Roseobacter sp. HKCCA0434]